MSRHEESAGTCPGLFDQMMNFLTLDINEWSGEDIIDWAKSVCSRHGIDHHSVNLFLFRSFTGTQLARLGHRELSAIVGNAYGLVFYSELQALRSWRRGSGTTTPSSSVDVAPSTPSSTTSDGVAPTDTEELFSWLDAQHSPLPQGSPWNQLLERDDLQDSLMAPLSRDMGAMNIVGGAHSSEIGETTGPFGGDAEPTGAFREMDNRDTYSEHCRTFGEAAGDYGSGVVGGDSCAGTVGEHGGIGGGLAGGDPEGVEDGREEDVERYSWALDSLTTDSRGRMRGPIVWEFLVRLLENPDSNPSLVMWENQHLATFRLVKPQLIARIWGTRLGNPDLTYNDFARTLRHHYKTRIILSSPDRQLVYGLGPKALQYFQQLRKRQ
ncbi:ETS-related transcription factor Elf-3 isoform X1 [Procambarus clarkii]|uniref:ETS-related transcription factor Elf-3 isoform X1 n=1 Tax=Procambarus clarkii TaxID=6728 RepID=UPI001E670285|nr:ETS-related transcription factor Elf-3-like [Procambarus clarkii]